MMRIRYGELRRLIDESARKAYDILGVSPEATADEIKRAYRRMVMDLHPDRNTGKDTMAAIKQLNVAKGLLSDPAVRSKYDASGDMTLGDAGVSTDVDDKSTDEWTQDFERWAAEPAPVEQLFNPFDRFGSWFWREAEKNQQDKLARMSPDERTAYDLAQRPKETPLWQKGDVWGPPAPIPKPKQWAPPRPVFRPPAASKTTSESRDARLIEQILRWKG